MAEENNKETNNLNNSGDPKKESQLPRWVQFVYEELEKHKKSKKVSDGAESQQSL